MFGRSKKPVSLEYKEKLLADIAYYEKRIEDALHKRVHSSSQDFESSDEESNPYTVNIGPFPMELKREEARLSNCVSMTLELAMLTIMQSEVNVMAAAPVLRRPVDDDGTWLEVAAECKIDLVSFAISFYAHKPHRKFAPTRYRGLQVSLTKAAHAQELAQSVLAKLDRPNLALQVLQSYATAFRSRRTTLLELAETYADRLKMAAMPEGGYRVKFLDLLTVEWTLENMWSPVVPFCHRMKFEVEYMPKHYIHAIGKLYKQFKDPSLETGERTRVLSKIFGVCSEAQAPARDLQDTFESDPETAGRLHERRTTIDQELEVPSSCDQSIQLSPQKLPKGKENKAQNRKTTMAPPKSLPKKAKKAANVNNKANNEVNDDNVSKSSKNNDKTAESDDVTKKTKPNDKGDATENRKGVKRAIENDATSKAKKIRSDEKNAGNATETVTENVKEVPSVSSKNDVQKKDNASSKSKRDKDTDVNSKTDGAKKKADSGKTSSNTKNLTKDSEASAKNVVKKNITSKNTANPKDTEADVAIAKKEAKKKRDAGSVATSNTAKKGADVNDGRNVASKEQGTEGSVASSKNSKKGEDGKSVASSKNASVKNSASGGSSKDINKKANDDKNKAVSKNLKDTMSTVQFSSKNKNAVEKDSNKQENKVKSAEVVEKTKVSTERKLPDNTEKEKTKVPVNNKKIVSKKTKDNEPVKQKEVTEITEKNVKAKQNIDKVVTKSKGKDKESLQEVAVKKNVVNTKNIEKKNEKNINAKTVENNTQKINKNKELLGQKMAKPLPEATKNTNSGTNKKNAATVVEKPKTFGLKVSNAQDKTKNVTANSNRNETVEKVVESNKVTAKITTNNLKNQKQDKTDKLQNIIPKKIVTEIAKPNIIKTNIQTDKSKENQAKIAEKLQTRIPMMKNKLKIGTFNNNLGKTERKIGKNAEKTKIPLKSLPVFKKIERNPTRMSPRKLPSNLKPSSHGFSNK